jgi:hypothetical protein
MHAISGTESWTCSSQSVGLVAYVSSQGRSDGSAGVSIARGGLGQWWDAGSPGLRLAPRGERLNARRSKANSLSSSMYSIWMPLTDVRCTRFDRLLYNDRPRRVVDDKARQERDDDKALG